MSTRKKTAAAVVLAATLAATVSGTAVAAGSPGTVIERSKITVCVTPKSTHLRLVPNSTKECPNGGRLMTWQASGKAGAAGQKGADGRDGVDGTDGASAYDIAVTYGFEGTEAEWLESLKGADGLDGANGTDGLDGVDGVDGRDGVDGQDGAAGMDGAPGLDGAEGPAGASAYEVAVGNGFVGTEAQWLSSLKGADGATGPAGPQGPQGEPGPAGAGITAGAMYERTAAMPSRADGRSTHTLTCDPGDVVLFPYHSLDGGMALVERMVPIGTDGVEFQVGGPTAPTEFVGIRCLDVDGGVVVP